jgi:MFS transporter, DHA2 family, multidrug resistance protein
LTADESDPRIPAGIDATERILAMFRQYGPNYRWWVTSVAMLGGFATLLTGTIINVAIPDIMGSLGMTPEEAQWLSTGFLASTTVTMLLAAWAIETFGMARTFIASMTIFLIGSIMGGIATSGEALIVARIVQGAGTGLMTPVTMLIIFQVFPIHRRGSAMGIQSVGMILAPAIGPALGGWLIDNFDWRYVFLLAIPFVMVSVPMALVFMPEREADARSPNFDWTGVALLTVFLASLLIMLSNGEKYEWGSTFVAAYLLITLTSGIAFLYWEAYVPDPMFNLTLFKHLPFAAASLVTFILGAGLYGSTYLVPLFLQLVQGLTPTDSGVLMVPAGLAMAAMSPLAGRLSDTLPPRNLILLGLTIFGVSALLFSHVDSNTPFVDMLTWAMLGRIGLAIVFPSLTTTSLKQLPLHLLAQGSGAINFLRQLGGAFGVNLLTILLQQRTHFHVDALTVAQDPSHTATTQLMHRVGDLATSAGFVGPFSDASAMSVLATMLYSQGSTLAFRDSFLAVAVVFFVCLVPVMFMDNSHPARQPARQ